MMIRMERPTATMARLAPRRRARLGLALLLALAPFLLRLLHLAHGRVLR
jgi:hypothetical protein